MAGLKKRESKGFCHPFGRLPSLVSALFKESLHHAVTQFEKEAANHPSSFHITGVSFEAERCSRRNVSLIPPKTGGGRRESGWINHAKVVSLDNHSRPKHLPTDPDVPCSSSSSFSSSSCIFFHLGTASCFPLDRFSYFSGLSLFMLSSSFLLCMFVFLWCINYVIFENKKV